MSGWTQEDLARRNREVLGITTEMQSMMDANYREYVAEGLAASNLLPEWMIEGECTKLLEEDGWRALRTDPVSDRGRGKGFGEVGMADHLYMRYAKSINSTGGVYGLSFCGEAQVMWIEFKSAKGTPSKAQIAWHIKERARGALTLIAGQDFPPSVAGFRDWYANSGLMRRTK